MTSNTVLFIYDAHVSKSKELSGRKMNDLVAEGYHKKEATVVSSCDNITRRGCCCDRNIDLPGHEVTERHCQQQIRWRSRSDYDSGVGAQQHVVGECIAGLWRAQIKQFSKKKKHLTSFSKPPKIIFVHIAAVLCFCKKKTTCRLFLCSLKSDCAANQLNISTFLHDRVTVLLPLCLHGYYYYYSHTVVRLRITTADYLGSCFDTSRSNHDNSSTHVEQQNETFSKRFKQEENRVDETLAGQQCHPSAIRQKETRKALALIAHRLRKKEAVDCGDSKIQTQKPTGPRFTSSLYFRLSRNLGLDNPELRLKKNLDRRLHSLTETQRAEAENNSCQVNGQTSPPDTLIQIASDQNEEVITVLCNEPEITRDLSTSQSFSNGKSGSHGRNGLCILPRHQKLGLSFLRHPPIRGKEPYLEHGPFRLHTQTKTHSPYDRSALHKTQSLPRRTTLTSTSWWKQVTQEGSSPLTPNDTTNIKEKPKTPLVPPYYGSNSNTRETQKPHDLPDVSSSSTLSRATVQTNLSHPKDLTKHDVSNSSFTAYVTELPPTMLNPTSPITPTESSSKYNNNLCTSKTNSTPTSTHNKDPQSSPSQPPKFNNIANTTPLGFERSYASVPKPFHPKTVSINAFSKSNYCPVSTVSTVSTTSSHPATTTVQSLSLLTPPVTPAMASSPNTVAISSLLTPPATPIITSPNYSDTSSPKEGRTLSSSQERDTKKPYVEGKKVRRVTWEDSVDLQCSEPIAVEKPEPTQIPTRSTSPSRSPRGIKAPAIFSFLRSSSPTTNTFPLCPPTPKTSSIEAVKGAKFRSLSSDSPDLGSREQGKSKQRPSDIMTFDQGRRDFTTPRQERTQSVESGTVQGRSSVPLSLPPDFSSGYKLRYSSPPYSTLMSTRSSQGETKTLIPRSSLFQQSSQSNYTPDLSINTDPAAVMTLPMSKPPLSPVSSPQSLSLSLQSKNKKESLKCEIYEIDQINNNHSRSNSQDAQLLLVNNRVHVSSQSLQGDNAHNSSSTCVTETLVYSIKPKVDPARTAPKKTTPKSLQHTANTLVSVETELCQQSHTIQSKEAAGEPSHSDQSSNSSTSTETLPPDDESSNRRMKESVLSKSRFLSVESNNEQSSKKSRFGLKKSFSTPNASLSRSESERANKTNNKMDQVLNKLRQTFSSRRSDDDVLFPWKWKRGSQTPSVSGSSDISNVSDSSVESGRIPEKQEQEKGVMLKDNEKNTDDANRWTQNRYTLTPSSASRSTMAEEKFYSWTDKSTPQADQDGQNACIEHMSECKNQPHLTVHSPTMHQFDFDYKDIGTTNQFLSCRDPNPGRSPNLTTAYPTQFGKSSSSPRSPFSPFSSLSPVSPFTSPDVTDDSVFYSPKLQRRRESPSPCEPAEGITLGGSRRNRASTGPPSASPEQDKEYSTSSYADLKYGIEPGRSFSVSSVLSSRPSGPGRISTGSRFLSVGDLSESALTCGGTGKDLYHRSTSSDWPTKYDCQPTKDCHMSYFPSDPGKMRSRSLPRSLTRCLANWSSEASPPVNTVTSKPARLWSPNMNTCHFAWDTEGPPTPPPTPPLSPVTKRMSRPPSLSSPTFPSSSGAPQQVDSQSSRGHLPSRGYVSSLSTFEESSDSSSDTTTDDEYYLETGEDEEKETEL
ncbi:hypothetical protein D9C73_022082 [Collichthys lucidus]|uniref:Uncharacterized protein n=1 Tax=Collichthys lucidus TaxID=240159 RepID=A0A4U5VIC5_COLLU|nr:hypothetical protein D9C73_022082 [Collichthys lucidus]